MNTSTSKRPRNRTAYNRALKEASQTWMAKAIEDPEFGANNPWPVFRPKYIQQAMAGVSATPRGRPASPNQTERQKYQQVYQGARRKAVAAYEKSTQLRAQFPSFTEYWNKHKVGWLPDGFFKRPGGKPLPPAFRSSQAKDQRTVYQVVYHCHRRLWEVNHGECWTRFNYSWDDYWTYVKAGGFPSKIEEAAIPDLVTYDAPKHNDLHGKQLVDRIPDGWIGRKKPPEQTHTITIAAVCMEGDTIEENSGWISAA